MVYAEHSTNTSGAGQVSDDAWNEYLSEAAHEPSDDKSPYPEPVEGRLVIWRYVGQPWPFRVVGHRAPSCTTVLGVARGNYALHSVVDERRVIQHPALPFGEPSEVGNGHEVDIAITATSMLAAAVSDHGDRGVSRYAQENGFAPLDAFGADADLALHWLTRWNLAEGRRCPTNAEARLHLTSDGVDVAGRLLRLHRWVEGQIEGLFLLLDGEGSAPVDLVEGAVLRTLLTSGLVRVEGCEMHTTPTFWGGMTRLSRWLPVGHSLAEMWEPPTP